MKRNRKKLIIFLCVVCTLIAFTLFYYGIEYIGINNGKGIDSIKVTVEKLTKIRYRLLNSGELGNIATDDFLSKVTHDEDYDYFYAPVPFFYLINDDFMDSYYESEDGTFRVTVALDDIGRGRIYQEITFIRDSDGKYLISDVQFDV